MEFSNSIRLNLAPIIATLVIMAGTAPIASAQVYKYADENGKVYFRGNYGVGVKVFTETGNISF